MIHPTAKVSEEVNGQSRVRNTTVQFLTVYVLTPRATMQSVADIQTDRLTDGRTDYLMVPIADHTIRSAKTIQFTISLSTFICQLKTFLLLTLASRARARTFAVNKVALTNFLILSYKHFHFQVSYCICINNNLEFRHTRYGTFVCIALQNALRCNFVLLTPARFS